ASCPCRSEPAPRSSFGSSRWDRTCSTSRTWRLRRPTARAWRRCGSRVTPGSTSTLSGRRAPSAPGSCRSCMSSSLSALLSATFAEPGYVHLVELVHQRDAAAQQHLEAFDVELYDASGHRLTAQSVDPRQEVLDLGTLVAEAGPSAERVLVLFDARYSERIFPYRPHHYAYLHRPAVGEPPL